LKSTFLFSFKCLIKTGVLRSLKSIFLASIEAFCIQEKKMSCTIESLKESMPGQSEEWYQRVSKAVVQAEEQSTIYSYKRSDLSPNNRVDRIKPETSGSSRKIETLRVSVDGKLLSLCLGDRSLAERLLFAQISSNPQRTQEWALEKTIWDLERDRGAR
jgi:hypothetical protein